LLTWLHWLLARLLGWLLWRLAWLAWLPWLLVLLHRWQALLQLLLIHLHLLLGPSRGGLVRVEPLLQHGLCVSRRVHTSCRCTPPRKATRLQREGAAKVLVAPVP
jgi:hypothetical protein